MFGKSNDEEAIQTVGALLRTLGTVDAEPVERQRLEAWAQHVVLQTAAPTTGLRPTHGRRDWPGVRAATTEIVERRAQRTQRAVGELRETVSAVTRTLVRAIAEDKNDDVTVKDELVRLHDAVQHGAAADIKRAAHDAVTVLAALLEGREKRHAAREQALHAETQRLSTRLEDSRKQAVEDALTGLVNRRGFDDDLARAVESCAVVGDRCCVVLFDLDHFKRVNDSWGHAAGDAVLKAVSRSLTLSFPRRGDCVARFGGEELVVLLRGTSITDARRLAERSLASIRALEIPVGDRRICVTASAGVAELSDDDDAVSFLQRADACLYAAKNAGRDRVVGDAGIQRPSQGVPSPTSPQGLRSA